MPRSVPEWIGRTPDTPVPPRVKKRVFDNCGGICHISGRKIEPGEPWECDHIIPLIEGGENRESNLAPALVMKHREKTRGEVARKAKVDRLRKKHLGIEGKKAKIGNPKFKRKVNGQTVWRDQE